MLVLTREKNEQIILLVPGQTPITIEIVDIRGSKIRVGLTADEHIQIWRKEIYQQIKEAKLTSGKDENK